MIYEIGDGPIPATHSPKIGNYGETELLLETEDGILITDESGLYYILLGLGFATQDSGDGTGSVTFNAGSNPGAATIAIGGGVVSGGWTVGS